MNPTTDGASRLRRAHQNPEVKALDAASRSRWPARVVQWGQEDVTQEMGRSPLGTLDPDAVRAWVRGQEAAQSVIDQERRQRLQGLDPEASLLLYMALLGFPSPGRPRAEPSPVLMAMRKAIERLQAAKASTTGANTREKARGATH